MARPQELTQESIQEWMRYDPDTGKMVRRLTSSSRAYAGYEFGCKNTNGYLVGRFAGKLHYLHRLIFLYMEGELPWQSIDHINGNPGDNTWVNLRKVTSVENNQNKIVDSGVYWAARDKVWVASFQYAGHKKHVGQHKDKAIAEAMYRAYKATHMSTLPGSKAAKYLEERSS